MKNYLMIIFLGIIGGAQLVLANGISDVHRNCMQKDWTHIECNYGHSPYFELPTTEEKSFESPVRNDYYRVTSLNKNHIAANGSRYSSSRGKSTKKKMMAMIEMKSKGLNSCQKAALVKCFTSSFLKYNDNWNNFDLMTLDEIYARRSGVCRQFAVIYHHLANHIGVKSHVAGCGDHAFNVVNIDDMWFSLEPQKNNADFYFIYYPYVSDHENSFSRFYFRRFNVNDYKDVSPEIDLLYLNYREYYKDYM